jgi:hypothetical protein
MAFCRIFAVPAADRVAFSLVPSSTPVSQPSPLAVI